MPLCPQITNTPITVTQTADFTVTSVVPLIADTSDGLAGNLESIEILADGKTKVYRAAAEPTGAGINNGDLWIDTDDGNKLYVRAGGVWVSAQDGAISTAQSTANTALSNAAAAQSSANTALSNAAAAQSSANTAITNAAAAQSSANTAITNAAAAQSTANTAITNASAAQSTANTAITNASAAQSTANTALANAATAYTAAVGSLQPSASTIVNASNQMTAIAANGITVYSGASATTGARVVLNSAGLAGFNSSSTGPGNGATFSINASTGAAVFSGNVTGATITGSDLNINGKFIVNGTTGVMTATDAVVTGNITATTGTFTGTVIANTGTFTGTVIATTGIFTGTVIATTGSFTGTVTATTGTFTGTVIANTGTFTGTVIATTGIFTGTVIATTGSFTGTVTATTGTFTGTVIANTGTFTGTVIATTGSFTGAIFSANGTIGGTNITSTALTGGTIQTSSGTDAVILNGASNALQFKVSGSVSGNLVPLGSAGIIMHYGSTPDGTGATYPKTQVTSSSATIAGSSSQSISAGAGGNTITGQTTVTDTITFSSTITANGNIDGGVNCEIYAYRGATNTTTGNAANAWLNSTTGRLARSTSSLRYKLDVQPQSIPFESIMALEPKSFYDKREYEENPQTAKRILGLIAEEVAQIPVLKDLLVNYDEEGKADAISYPTIAVAILPFLKDLYQRIQALEQGR